MEQNNGLMRKIEKNILLQIAFFIISMGVLFGAYFLAGEWIKQQFVVTADSFFWMHQVDNIKVNDNKMTITGFAFRLNEDANDKNFELILYDMDSGKGYYPSMTYTLRDDVEDYFKCEYNYQKSGYVANISLRKLNIENSNYEILIRPAGGKDAFKTGVYICKGEMTLENPQDFVEPKVAGTNLEGIVGQGKLRVYRGDVGVYVYQYANELYWIIDCKKNNEEDFRVQFQMNTTQIDRLPQERLEDNKNWSNLSFSFKDKEIDEWRTEDYRVAKCELPRDYSLTKLWTGKYVDNQWIWYQNFRPWFDFLVGQE